METRDRLKSGRGNAMLVSGSIYQACKFYELFSRTDLAGKCAIVTSYRPLAATIKGEDSGEGPAERLRQYEIYRKMLADWFNDTPENAANRVDEFEKQVKKKFIDERLAVIGKLAWVKRQRAQFETQPRQSEREMVSGESHYFLGRRYRLRVVLREGFSTVAVRGKSIIEMYVRPEMGPSERERALHRWYRQNLRQIIVPLLEKWRTALGVPVTECRIKKMKTKWGTCNADARRIWLNLELAKKPVQCIEYVMVHELVHLLERHHSDRFVAIMDRSLPQWRVLRQELNAAPLAHETWSY